jgi:fermentation-respiration switch protein FrsA (DUF1100 family)
MLWIILGTFAGTYVLICVLIYIFQGALLYFPDADYGITPDQVGLAYEDVRIETSDSETIAAWYVPHEEPLATVLFFHGNAGNMADRFGTLKTFHQLGCSTLIVDYRGYGASTGSPNEQGTYLDGEAAHAWLLEKTGLAADAVVIFGRSLGGAVAIEMARRHPPAALIVENTFPSVVAIGQREYPILPVTLLATNRYDSVAKVPDITCPKLFLHGRTDEIIPLSEARRLFDAAAEPKTFIETEGGHNEAGFEYNDGTLQQFRDWLVAAVDGD